MQLHVTSSVSVWDGGGHLLMLHLIFLTLISFLQKPRRAKPAQKPHTTIIFCDNQIKLEKNTQKYRLVGMAQAINYWTRCDVNKISSWWENALKINIHFLYNNPNTLILIISYHPFWKWNLVNSRTVHFTLNPVSFPKNNELNIV